MFLKKLLITIALIFFNYQLAIAENKKSIFLPLTANGISINAELAIDEQQREYGLMYRNKLSENDGMLFVFPYPTKICMWMKNTILPLSVAFFGKDERIVNIEEMMPNTLSTHCSATEVEYALEMNRHWFKKQGITPGSKIEGLLK